MAYSLAESRLRRRRFTQDRVARNLTCYVASSMGVPFFEGHGTHVPVREVDDWFDTSGFHNKAAPMLQRREPVIGRAVLSRSVTRLQESLYAAAGRKRLTASLWLNPVLAYCSAGINLRPLDPEQGEDYETLAMTTHSLHQLARDSGGPDSILAPWIVGHRSEESTDLVLRSRSKGAGTRSYSACLRVRSPALELEQRRVSQLAEHLDDRPVTPSNLRGRLLMPLVNISIPEVETPDAMQHIVEQHRGHEALRNPIVLASIGAQAIWLSRP